MKTIQSRSYLPYILLLVLTFLLYGCNSTQSTSSNLPKQKAWRQNQVKLNNIKSFKVNGSLAYEDDRTRSYGRFFLIQNAPNSYYLKFTTPFGGSVFSMKVSPSNAVYEDANGRVLTERSAQALIAKITGMDIPLDSLHNWLLGINANYQAPLYNSKGQLVKEKITTPQGNWNLSVTRFTKTNKNGLELPGKLELSNSEIKMTFTLSNWDVQ